MTLLNPPVCAVTGALGSLGSRVCAAFQNKGWNVYKMVRTPLSSGENDSHTLIFSLDQTLPPDTFRSRSIQVLIHCAYDTLPTSWQEIHRINVEGSIRLFESAQAGGVEKIIYVSSTSANEDSRSLYGKAKLEIEKYVLKQGGEIVRSGLIFSDRLGGMLGKIVKSVSSSRILPVITHPRHPIYLAHIDDVANLILYLATKPPSAQHFWMAASSQPWTLTEIVKRIAKNQGRRVLIIPVPWQCLWSLLKGLESLGIRLPFRSDSILGLVYSDIRFTQNEVPPVSFREFGDKT